MKFIGLFLMTFFIAFISAYAGILILAAWHLRKDPRGWDKFHLAD